MAVSSLSRGRAVDDDARAKESRSDLSNNNTSASKRVTPFSIDDILSKCDSVSALPETSVASNPAADQCTAKIDSICNQCLGPGGGLHLWKSDIYAMWLENFNRLYAASALQPFLMTTGPSPIAASDRLNRLLGGDSSNLTSSNRTLDYLISKSRSRICPRSRSVARQSNSRNLSSGSVPNKEAAGAVVSENGDRTPVSAKTNSGVVDADERARRGCDGDAKPPERESVSESPLDALERLACATFKGMEESEFYLNLLICLIFKSVFFDWKVANQ